MPSSKKSQRTTAKSPAGDSRSDTPKTTHPPARSRRERDADARVERKTRAPPRRAPRPHRHPRLVLQSVARAPPRPIVNMRQRSRDPRPGARGRLLRLRAGRRHQLPPPRAQPRPAGQPAHALRHGPPLRRVAARELLRLLGARRDEGLDGARRLRVDTGRRHATARATSRRRSRARGSARPAAPTSASMHRQIRDMHAALGEVGILYCTLQVHGGWDEQNFGDDDYVKYRRRQKSARRREGIPVIKRVDGADGGPRHRPRRLHQRGLHRPELLGRRHGAPAASRSSPTKTTCSTPPTCGSRRSASPSA